MINGNDEVAAAVMYRSEMADAVQSEDFGNIVALCARLCDMPGSGIAFATHEGWSIRNQTGLAISENDLAAFLAHSHSHLSEDLVIVNGSSDILYVGEGLISAHKSGIGSFAATPILEDRDHVLAYLYVIDIRLHSLTPGHVSALKMLGKQAKALLGLLLQNAELKGKQNDTHYHPATDSDKSTTSLLESQKKFYENILNKLPADIVVFDKDHRYLFVNPNGVKDEALRKYIIGKDDFEYAAYRGRNTAIAEKRREQFLQLKATGKEVRWEDTIRNPQGNPITHLRGIFPVYDDNGELNVVIGFGIDITDRKLMEEKQAALVRQLSAQNMQLTDFCNIVSHNLRGPLVNMTLLANFIEEIDDAQEMKLFTSKLRPVIENLNATFNELVESIQIKQDLEIKSENIALTECLQRTLNELALDINKTAATIEADFSGAPAIYYPPKYLYSIFHNLVSNALKYKSPDRKPFITIQSKYAGGSIILSVKDNGSGIDLVKHKDSVFKIGKVFHDHPNARGFGLFMTRTQVEAMEGRIWVEAAPDKGATFFIEFKNQAL